MIDAHSNHPCSSHRKPDRGRVAALALLVPMVLAVAVSCDSTAKFGINDRKFIQVQVVTAFPAEVSDTGTIRRVCGINEDIDFSDPSNPTVQLWQPPAHEGAAGATAPVANGIEINMNFVGSELKKRDCNEDKDQSIKERELIDLTAVQTSSQLNPGQQATVGTGNFQLNFDCVEEHAPIQKAICKSNTISVANGTPTAVAYRERAGRCHPQKENTRLNVALLLDHSGSVSGFVDKDSFKEDNPKKVSPPQTLLPSDPKNVRISAVESFVQALNERDRLVGFYYNEEITVRVAADDNLLCIGGSDNGEKCVQNSDCSTGNCFPGGAQGTDKFAIETVQKGASLAFGANKKSRIYLQTALNDKVKYGGKGRTPLWEALNTAYDFLAKAPVDGNRHIVIVGDGPDTCTESEDFTFKGSGGDCRQPCQEAFTTFRNLRIKMAKANYPVTVHFVQFQSHGYQQPDAHMMELACRTGGTFQFINSREIPDEKADAMSTAMTRAMLRVRYALAGNWRVGYRMQAMQKNDVVFPGKSYSLAGHIRFQNQSFPSLDGAYKHDSSWRFALDADNVDRRMVFRKPCYTHADCGGSDECSPNHCSPAGMCVPSPAPDKLPCGDGTKRCCKGKCEAKCDTCG